MAFIKLRVRTRYFTILALSALRYHSIFKKTQLNTNMEKSKQKYRLLGFTLFLLIWSSAVYSQEIKPASSFAIKGFHLDLRIQVMKMPALKSFVSELKKGGINTLVMEWEATYPFKNHPLIPNRYAYSREEIKSFISYCNKLKIDVIPLQQSFGHVEYILRNNKYADLREDQKDFSQINPLEEEKARALFTDLYKDLISTHTSPYIHIGGDETYLLGHSEASKKKVAKVGMGRLYGDYLKMLCEVVISLGKRPVVWADIALHYPDALKSLPKETVFVDWNYGWDLNHFGDHDKLMNEGFEIWGSPAIRSAPDNYYLTDWSKHLKNIADFVPEARRLNYKGIVMTSWSTSGIYSPVFESTSDIIDLYAVRHVYPITGFNMLISAYFQSINQLSPILTSSFIKTYSKTRYGFNEQQSAAFWEALIKTPYEVVRGKPDKTGLTVNQLLDSAVQASAVLKNLKPLQNKAEFDHYRLMAAIRVQYLRYTAVETQANAADFKAQMIPELLAKLKALDTEVLDREFIRLNKDVLYPGQLKEENELRDAKINLLLNRLLKAR
jgi:hexosaminidase